MALSHKLISHLIDNEGILAVCFCFFLSIPLFLLCALNMDNLFQGANAVIQADSINPQLENLAKELISMPSQQPADLGQYDFASCDQQIQSLIEFMLNPNE